MLREAASMRERGVDVVIGYVDTHDRPDTAAQIGDLEMLPRKTINYQSRMFEEVDLNAILQRRPEVVVIDELAHSNAPGSLFPKRYMDVEYLLDHGISVMTAVNVQHIEGIHREAEEITKVHVRELVPYSIVKRAHEVSVIDVTPETLRQRLLDGSIYPPEKVDHALRHFFRKSNLSGLRELALRLVAEDVDERLQNSYSRRRIPGPVGAKEVIMVCVGHYARAWKLIRRAHRMAVRMKADLHVLTIAKGSPDQLSDRERTNLSKLEELAHTIGAQWIVEPRNDRKIGAIVTEVVERLNVTQVVVGQPISHSKWKYFGKENPVRYLLRNLKYTDIRIVGWRDFPAYTLRIARESGMQSDVGAYRRPSGRLTIYVGAAPGVGKTYKMLQDAHDWRNRGWDVVIGLVETHGRAETAEQIGDLETIPKRKIQVDGRVYEELDVNAIVRRKPAIVLIDELAHSNVPGSEREKRYQDIEYLLEQGIHVVTAVNIQHLESLHDKVEHITGVKVRERVPDWFMRLAREIKLIDVTPETLQHRLRQGQIYTREKIQYALDHFFQTSNLAALRELALLEVADDVDQRIHRESESRLDDDLERVLVCVNHRPHSEKLIRRGWRLADRLNAELWVLVVLTFEPMSEQAERDLANIEKLSEQFDAHFVTARASDNHVGKTIVQMAHELAVSWIVAGQPVPPKRLIGRIRKNPLDYVLENAEFVDLHVVAHGRDGS